MITPQLSAHPSTDGGTGVLRADAIRRDTLMQIAAARNEDGGSADIDDAFDHLAAVMQSPATTEGELDAAIQAVEDAGDLDYPEIPLTREQARRLRADLGRVEAALTLPRVGEQVPQQRDGGAAA